MNYLLVPDLAAMAMLLSILYFLRRRHPREAVDLWLIGLLFIFFEAIIHAAYPGPGAVASRRACHCVELLLHSWSDLSLGLGQRALSSRTISSLSTASTLCLPLRCSPSMASIIRDPRVYHGDRRPAVCSSASSARSLSRVPGSWAEAGGFSSSSSCTWVPIWLFASAELLSRCGLLRPLRPVFRDRRRLPA